MEVLIFASVDLSQTPAYAATPRIHGLGIVWCAHSCTSFCRYSSFLPAEGWPGSVELSSINPNKNEGSVHKGSISIYFWLLVFYTIWQMPTSLTSLWHQFF